MRLLSGGYSKKLLCLEVNKLQTKAKIGLLVQARIDSRRLPNKILLKCGDYSILEHIWKSLDCIPDVDHRILVTTSRPIDDELAEKAKNIGFEVFRGDLSNVYSRFHRVCDIYNLDVILRFTGDNPFIDARMVRRSIDHFLHFQMESEPVFLSTRNTFMPVGMDIEIFSKEVLSLDPKNLTTYDEEHVTPWMYSDARIIKLEFLANLPKADCSVTVDTLEDLIVADKILSWLENQSPSFELIKSFFETQH